MNQPAPPPLEPAGPPAGPDEQLAGWLAAVGLPAVISDMTDVADLAARAARLAVQHAARDLIRSVLVWPLGDGTGEALITVDPPDGPRLATLTVTAREFTGLTSRQALARLLDLARAQTSGLDAYLDTGGRHHDHARLETDLAELAAVAASLGETALGDLVHDAASIEASGTSNDGMESQVELLARVLGPKAALALLRDAAGGTGR